MASSQTLNDMAKELQVVQKGLVRRVVGIGKVLFAEIKGYTALLRRQC